MIVKSSFEALVCVQHYLIQVGLISSTGATGLSSQASACRSLSHPHEAEILLTLTHASNNFNDSIIWLDTFHFITSHIYRIQDQYYYK